MAKNLLINAIDIGSSSIKGMVAVKRAESKTIEVLSYHSIPSFGLRKGMVIDPNKVCEKVTQVKSLLEEESGKKIKEAYVNIGGYHIFVKSGHGAVAISRADQKVSQEDIDRVIEEARSISLPFNKEILEVHPREFTIDGESGIKNPLDLKGIKLEVETLIVCAFSPYVKNLIDAILCSDLEIIDMVPSPLASAEAVLTPQQKELGVALVDIGAGSTGIAVFEEETLIHLAILPVGSSHISNDIAIALQTDIDVAEKIKLKFGDYVFKKSNKKEKIELAPNEIFTFSTKKLAKAGKARVSEIFDLIKKELKKISKSDTLPAGIVLTGGGSKLPGIVEFAKKELSLPVRIGMPKNFIGLKADPSNSVLCGLILKGMKEEEEKPGGFEIKIPSKLRKILRKIFRTFLP
jgi:cell division protein FtsA